MKKILCIIGQLGNGGTEKQLYLFLKYLDQTRYTAKVFVSGEEGGIWAERISDDLGVDIVFTGDVSKLSKISRYRKVLKEFKPDVIFSWSYFTNSLKLFSGNIKFVGSLRQQYSEALKQYGAINTRLSRSPSHFVVNSTFIADEFADAGYPSQQISVIYNMFEQPESTLERNTVACELRNQFELPDDAVIVMGVGGNAPAKNFSFFVDVMNLAIENNNQIYAVIIGAGGLAQQDYIQEQGLSNRIFTLGEIPNAKELMYGADIFFLSSKEEGMPNVLIEAVDAGCATLATDVGGVRDIYKFVPEDKLNNILLTDFEVDKAADKLLRLAGDRELRKAIVKHTTPFLDELAPDKIMQAYYQALDVKI